MLEAQRRVQDERRRVQDLRACADRHTTKSRAYLRTLPPELLALLPPQD